MKVIRKCLCVCLALIVSLSVYKSNSAFAEMHGVANIKKLIQVMHSIVHTIK